VRAISTSTRSPSGAEGVVDGLEVVYVDQGHDEGMAAGAVRADPLLHGALEAAAVGDARELVDRRFLHRLRQPHLQALDLGREIRLVSAVLRALVGRQPLERLDFHREPALQDADVVDVDDLVQPLRRAVQLVVEAGAATQRRDHLAQDGDELRELRFTLGQMGLRPAQEAVTQVDALRHHLRRQGLGVAGHLLGDVCQVLPELGGFEAAFRRHVADHAEQVGDQSGRQRRIDLGRRCDDRSSPVRP
jgi:hypothetical protein